MELVIFILIVALLSVPFIMQGYNGLPEKERRDAQIICPQCQQRGHVTTRSVRQKKGISGGKATAAILTGGLSILATGLSRKEDATEAECSNCGSIWHF
jgi:hypothetical protein